MSAKRNAVIRPGEDEDHGAGRDHVKMTPSGSVFKGEALSFLSPAARAELERDVRAIVNEQAALPSHVTQRTSERWTGLPPRDYLAASRAEAFPSNKWRRLIFARTADVIAWIESHRSPASDDADEWADALQSAGARRVAC